jgi:MFS transporter, DHA1 family, solute carrier family 18 (vesicular amine transporter), member 1/2
MVLQESRGVILALVTFAAFTDIVAYSIAVPVLPDLSRKLGASPTTIGLLFASFGLTLLTVSIPMGAVSDRIGRRGLLVAGMLVLAVATLLFAFSDSLPILFLARLAQGGADAVTWVVGLALLADVYEASERGRATGIVMSGTGFAFMIGPSLGGWLYEIGGVGLPFVMVAVMAVAAAVAFLSLAVPLHHTDRDPVPVLAVVRVPAVAACAAAVVVASSTSSMLEPVLALHLEAVGTNPGRIGVVFGIAAVATTILNPVFGRLADRWGARRLTLWGLIVSAAVMPMFARTWSFASATASFPVQAAAIALVITPSLAYMAEAVSDAGLGSFGVAYGLYNVAWGIGLLAGPAVGGFLFERVGFRQLLQWWAPLIVVVTIVLARLGNEVRLNADTPYARR